MGRKRSRADELLDRIGRLLAEFSDIPEAEMYEVLLGEAEGWKMRLRELEDDQEKGGA